MYPDTTSYIYYSTNTFYCKNIGSNFLQNRLLILYINSNSAIIFCKLFVINRLSHIASAD